MSPLTLSIPGTSFNQVLTLAIRKSVKSLIQTTLDGKIRFSIEFCIQMHWLILKKNWFWQVLWPYENHIVGEPRHISRQTWRQTPFSWSVNNFSYCVSAKSESKLYSASYYLTWFRKNINIGGFSESLQHHFRLYFWCNTLKIRNYRISEPVKKYLSDTY